MQFDFGMDIVVQVDDIKRVIKDYFVQRKDDFVTK